MLEIIKEKVTSRKFWLGAALVIIGTIMYLRGDTSAGSMVIRIGAVGYIGAEAICDVFGIIWNSGDAVEETEEEEAEDDSDGAAE